MNQATKPVDFIKKLSYCAFLVIFFAGGDTYSRLDNNSRCSLHCAIVELVLHYLYR